jgi:hypothetical protein
MEHDRNNLIKKKLNGKRPKKRRRKKGRQPQKKLNFKAFHP